MSSFLTIQAVHVPRELALESNAHLRSAGEHGVEGLALWAGERIGEIFQVRQALIPAQTGHRTSEGVFVHVAAEELFRINMWLYQHGMTLIAQLHSHPAEAYHSSTDDAFPIATTLGSLSIVVPEFARHPFALSRCAVYQLHPGPSWQALSPTDTEALIKIEG